VRWLTGLPVSTWHLCWGMQLYTYRNGLTGRENHAQTAGVIRQYGPLGIRIWK
jgi:hypothetical protein